MCRRLERFDCAELERFTDPVRQHRPNAWDSLEQGFRAGLPLQVLEEAPPAGREHFGDRASYGGANAGDCLQRFAPAPLGDSADIIIQRADRVGSSAIGRDAERIGSLRCQDVRGLTKFVGDLGIPPAKVGLLAWPDRAALRLEASALAD